MVLDGVRVHIKQSVDVFKCTSYIKIAHRKWKLKIEIFHFYIEKKSRYGKKRKCCFVSRIFHQKNVTEQKLTVFKNQ